MKRRIKKELKRTLIIFADVWGFGRWSRRVNPKEYRILSDSMDLEFDRYEESNPCFFKLMGDGFMAVFPFQTEKHISNLDSILNNIFIHQTKMSDMIENHPYYPRPNGYRVRVSLGHVWHRKGKNEDYSGYWINMTAHLLAIRKEIPIIIHQSAKELISEKMISEWNYKFKKIKPPVRYYDGIDKEDINSMWGVKSI